MKTQIKKNFENKNAPFSQIFLILAWSSHKDFQKTLFEYYHIWPLFQWVTSLLTLIIIYWISGYFYNKFLSSSGGWMDAKTRLIMIGVDLILNFILGIYYMQYRETWIGALMLQCPVFLSPIFWLIELICFYVYSKYILDWKKNK